jgi:hypothetical protein
LNIEAILGSLVVAAFAAYFAYRTFLKKRRVEGADKFHLCITNTLKDLYSERGVIEWPTISGFDITTALKNRHDTLDNAVLEYSRTLSDKTALMNDWNAFRGITNNSNKEDYFQFTGHTIDGLPKEDREVIFHRSVSNLLKHSKT